MPSLMLCDVVVFIPRCSGWVLGLNGDMDLSRDSLCLFVHVLVRCRFHTLKHDL